MTSSPPPLPPPPQLYSHYIQVKMAQLGDDDVEDEHLIEEELKAYKASRAAALQQAKLHPVLEAARQGNDKEVSA